MTDELFTTPPSDSPRLAWMKRHGVKIESTGDLFRGPLAFPEYLRGTLWVCHKIKPQENEWRPGKWKASEIGGGMTEDEAIADFARNAGIRLWNEENL